MKQLKTLILFFATFFLLSCSQNLLDLNNVSKAVIEIPDAEISTQSNSIVYEDVVYEDGSWDKVISVQYELPAVPE